MFFIIVTQGTWSIVAGGISTLSMAWSSSNSSSPLSILFTFYEAISDSIADITAVRKQHILWRHGFLFVGQSTPQLHTPIHRQKTLNVPQDGVVESQHDTDQFHHLKQGMHQLQSLVCGLDFSKFEPSVALQQNHHLIQSLTCHAADHTTYIYC